MSATEPTVPITTWDESYDFVVIGSGGGSLIAGLVMRDHDASVLIVEKEDFIGGSTSMSGGVLWVPNHPLQAKAGVSDSPAAAATYLDAIVGDDGPATSPARKRAFLETGPALVAYLQGKGVPFFRCEGWSDYRDELPGGCPRGRSLGVPLLDLRSLGDWADRLRRGPMSLPLRAGEGAKLALAKRSMGGMLAVLGLGLRMARVRLTGARLVGTGAALYGRTLQAALEAGVEIRPATPCVDIVKQDECVVGIVVGGPGARRRIEARRGVLINCGGFSHNQAMREKFQPKPASVAWTNSNPGDTGEIIELAIRLGAATDLMDQAVWLPSSLPPGSAKPIFHVADMAKPHSIVVGRDGKRFVDEAGSYMIFGQQMYATGNVPAFAILESRNRNRYPWSMAPPGIVPEAWLGSGYMKKAGSVRDLATSCGIDPDGLEETIAQFNGYAAVGMDPAFHRGERAYDKVWADPSNRPSPTLGAIERPPFYAVEIVPGDVGTFGGILTDENARVIRQVGSVVHGLYATGNCTASVMGRTYPGAGASISASFVFGMIAARHALGNHST